MKIPLTYGFFMALGGALLTLLLFFSGFHDNAEKMKSAQWVGGLAGAAIGIVCLVLAMKEKRANHPADSDWGYGSAFGVGFLTSLFGVLFGCVTAYLYAAFINPNMNEVIVQMQIAAMEERGMPAAQIEQAEPMMRKWMSPGMMIVWQAGAGLLWSVILSLIIAIFYRRRPATSFEGEAPPTLG